MSPSRSFIPQRKPVFVGCEGESEQGYAQFLQDLIREAGLHVHLNITVLRGGDPLAKLQAAVKKVARVRFEDKFVFLDTDQLESNRERAKQAQRLAAENAIRVIWQHPCHEAFLIRHFPGRAMHRPPDDPSTRESMTRLWPGYQKPASRAELARKFDRAAVLRAAKVEDGLLELLRCVGLKSINKPPK